MASKRRSPHSLHRDRSVDCFKEWLTANGAEILSATNLYEVVRFRGDAGTSVIYSNDHGRPYKMTGQAPAAWDAFTSGQPMRFTASVEARAKRDPIVRTLLDRDGSACFYCDEPFTADVLPTREHLVSRTHGGPDHIANQFLACVSCNREAGHLSAPEKIRMRDELRTARQQASAALAASIAQQKVA